MIKQFSKEENYEIMSQTVEPSENELNNQIKNFVLIFSVQNKTFSKNIYSASNNFF